MAQNAETSLIIHNWLPGKFEYYLVLKGFQLEKNWPTLTDQTAKKLQVNLGLAIDIYARTHSIYRSKGVPSRAVHEKVQSAQ